MAGEGYRTLKQGGYVEFEIVPGPKGRSNVVVTGRPWNTHWL
ncbi:MAG: hypothetical protein DMG40_22090 [Acidobacteria bacterium]|nr:MAG: hypothetical protein DMG40_22090 [Acidobacteriota bacterium]